MILTLLSLASSLPALVVPKTLAEFSQAAQNAPKHPQAYYQRALFCFNKGQHQLSLEDLNLAIGFDAGQADFCPDRGNAHASLQQIEPAIQDGRQACKLGFEKACTLLKENNLEQRLRSAAAKRRRP